MSSKMKRVIKLFSSNDTKACKRINYPDNFAQLLNSAKEFTKPNDPNKKYELIEEETKRAIEDQEDFELMTKHYNNKATIKININFVDKSEQDKINDNINNNIDNKNRKEIQKEEEIKYKIPEEIKENFRKKLIELGEQFLAEVEKNINSKKENAE